MAFPLEYLKRTLHVNWTDALKRILPSKRHLHCLGHATRSREEVWQKVCLLDTFKYSINAEMTGNANNDSLNRSLTLTGDQLLITLWMPGTSFHSTDLVLVAYNCVSSVHFSSCRWCKTEKGNELNFRFSYCHFFPFVLLGLFLSLVLCCGTGLPEKNLCYSKHCTNTNRTPQRVYRLIKAIYIHNWLSFASPSQGKCKVEQIEM